MTGRQCSRAHRGSKDSQTTGTVRSRLESRRSILVPSTSLSWDFIINLIVEPGSSRSCRACFVLVQCWTCGQIFDCSFQRRHEERLRAAQTVQNHALIPCIHNLSAKRRPSPWKSFLHPPRGQRGTPGPSSQSLYISLVLGELAGLWEVLAA